jgi:hypothetical protein
MKVFKFLFRKILLLCFAMIVSASALASDFCTGFEEGYKALAGDMVFVPFCPLEPITPIGSTPYREGLKAGMAAARRAGYTG